MAGPISLVQAYQEEERACFCGSKRLDFQKQPRRGFLSGRKWGGSGPAWWSQVRIHTTSFPGLFPKIGAL